jgi:hypothetical protein
MRLVHGLLLLALLAAWWLTKPEPAGGQGVGVFVRADCTTLTAPVTGQTFCLDQTAQQLKVWTGTVWATPPLQSGTTPPATCALGSVFYDTDAPVGSRFLVCDPTNTWGVIGSTPGGSTTQVQFNDAGAFGGDAGLTYNKTTDTLTIGGGLSVASATITTGQLLLPVGTVSAPPLSFSTTPTLGFKQLSSGASVISMVRGGAEVIRFDQTTIELLASGQLAWNDGTFGNRDLFLSRDAANILAQRNGTNAQAFRLYNIDSGANDEYLSIAAASNIFTIGPVAMGSGTLRAFNIDHGAGILFANLGTPANGQQVYCPDCTFANPCAGAGTGAIAKRLNGAWRCD